MVDKNSVRALNGAVLAMAVFASVFVWTSSMDPFNLPKMVVLVAGGTGALFALGSQLKNFRREQLILSTPLLAFLLVYVFCALAGTSNAHRLLFGAFSRATGLLSYVSMALLALGAILGTRGAKFSGLYIALASLGTFEVLYGLLQYLKVDPISWVNPYNPVIGTLGNPNFMSACLGFVGVAMAGIALNRTQDLWARIGGGVLSLGAFLLGLSSDSVQGPIAYAGGLAFLLGVWIWERKGKSPIFFAYSGLAGAILVIVLLGVARIGPLAEKLYQYTLDVRSHYWRAAIKMMMDHPFTGVGVDSYGDHYRLVRDSQMVSKYGPQVFTNAAHSVPLQLGATVGLLALISYAFLQFFVLYRGFVAMKIYPEHRIAIAGIIGAWLAFQAQSLISIDQLGVAVWGWVLSGSIIGGSYLVTSAEPTKRVRRKDIRKSKFALVASMAVFGIVLGFALGWQGYLGDLHIRQAIGLPYDKQNQQSLGVRTAALQTASDGIQGDPYYQSLVVQELVQMNQIDQSISILKRTIRDHPESFDSYAQLTDLYEQTQRVSAALPYRREMIKLDPKNWQLWYYYARALELSGEKSEAKRAYAHVLSTNPKSAEAETSTAAITRLG